MGRRGSDRMVGAFITTFLYLWNQCLSLLTVSPTNKTDRHDITEILFKEESEDTNGVIRIRISKKNRHLNGQRKKYKRTNNDLQNIHIKLKIE